MDNQMHFNKWWACVLNHQQALCLQHINYSFDLHKHKMNDDGKEWFYFSGNQWAQRVFPFVSRRTVDGWIEKLEQSGMIQTKKCVREGFKDNNEYTHFRMTELFYHVEKEIRWYVLKHENDKKYTNHNGNLVRCDLLGKALCKHIKKLCKAYLKEGEAPFCYTEIEGVQNLPTGVQNLPTPLAKTANGVAKTANPPRRSCTPIIRYKEKSNIKDLNNNYNNEAAAENSCIFDDVINLWCEAAADDENILVGQVYPVAKEQEEIERIYEICRGLDMDAEKTIAEVFEIAAADDFWGKGIGKDKKSTSLYSILTNFWTVLNQPTRDQTEDKKQKKRSSIYESPDFINRLAAYKGEEADNEQRDNNSAAQTDL